MSEQETIIFLHIPKTAGTTLNHILDRQYPARAVHKFGPHAQASVAAFKTMPQTDKARIQLLSGHMGFGLHTAFPQAATYFTMLRDPVERVLSYYHFIHRTPDHYLYDTIVSNNMSLLECLENKIPVMMNNGQTRLLSGVWGKVGFGKCDADMLAVAQENLVKHFAVVGLMEEFDASLLLLQQAFAWENIFYKRRNVTKEQKQVDEATREAVLAVNQLDLKLYAFAQELFAEQAAAQGRLFPARVRLFQLQNWLHGTYWELRRHSLRVYLRETWAKWRQTA